jgi:hypothetical protein
MSLLGAHRAELGELTRDRVIWIALHAFEGAGERWACRLAKTPTMDDRAIEGAIVQEMGGPAQEADEMTTLGFWLGDVGFHFDCRGPSVEMIQWSTGATLRRRRIGRGSVIAAARRMLSVGVAPEGKVATADEGGQLLLL